MNFVYAVSILIALFVVAVLFAFKRIEAALLTEIRENEALKKWSSVGQMAGGIAHEVNTPLTAMILTLEGLLDRVESDDVEKIKSDVHKLIHTSRKIENIVRSLRMLTMTGGHFQRDEVSLFDIVISAKNEFEEVFREKQVDFAYMYNIQSSGKVWGSASALKHVLTNLVKNAVEAIEVNDDLDAKWIKILLVENKTEYKILVQNGGPHISPQVVEKIFEPFYSTKDVGAAMGIGLSISKTLILAHGGQIRVDANNPHVTFEITLGKMQADIKPRIRRSSAA